MTQVNLLHRYVILQVIAAASVAVGVFIFLFLTGNALRDIFDLLASGRLTPLMAAEVLLLLLPWVIPFAIPLGLLTGTLLVLGRMSARREIVAMKASGYSIWRISAPILVLAVSGVGVSLVSNAWYAPRAKSEYRGQLASVARTDPLRFIVPRTFVDEFPGYILYAGEKEGNRLSQLFIWVLDDEGNAIQLVRAESATLTYDSERDALILRPESTFVELRSQQNPNDLQASERVLNFRTTRFDLPLDRIFGFQGRSSRLSYLDLRQLFQRLRELQAERLTIEAGGTVDDGAAGQLEREVMRVRMQAQEYFSSSFAVLSLVLIGIPLGIRAGRSETYANFGVAILLALVYYFMNVIVSWLADYPALRPDLLMWLPNLLFQLLGFILILRANRY